MSWFDDEGFPTTTSSEQCDCEKICFPLLEKLYCFDKAVLDKYKREGLLNVDTEIRLQRRRHIEYLLSNLEHLSQGFVTLDASRPWIIYWIIHSLFLLDTEIKVYHNRILATLKSFQNIYGGYGGGPGQISQGAPNYASVLTLCIIGSPDALNSINRNAMYQWFLALKQPHGGFAIHIDGEADTRSTYTVISVARLLNILTDQLKAGVAEFVQSCQTYEGFFSF